MDYEKIVHSEFYRKVNYRMKICGIYCIFNKVNHKRYIGQSTDIYLRWSQHKSSLTKKSYSGDNHHLTYAWHKYGEDNFELFVVEQCKKSELDTFETFWINYYDSTNPYKGYNKTKGGRFDYKITYPKKDKVLYMNKCGVNYQGHVLSEDDVKQIIKLFDNKESNTSIAKKFNVSKSLIASIRKHKSWTYLTDGLNLGHSDYYNTHKFTDGHAKSVDMYTLNGDFIKTFSSISDVTKEYNISQTGVSGVCKGKNISAKGYVFRYHKCDFDSLRTEKKRDPKSVPIDQYDLSWNYIRSYNSINEAYTITGINNIQNVLSKPELTRGKYHWLHKGEQPPVNNLHKMKRWVAVDQYDLNWNLIATYPSIKLASCETDINADKIWRVIYGKRKSTGGYYWRKHEEIC